MRRQAQRVLPCLLILVLAGACGEEGSGSFAGVAVSTDEVGLAAIPLPSGEEAVVEVVDENGDPIDGVEIHYLLKEGFVTGVVTDPLQRYAPAILDADIQAGELSERRGALEIRRMPVFLTAATAFFTLKMISVGLTTGWTFYHAVESAGHFTIESFYAEEIRVCADRKGVSEFIKTWLTPLKGRFVGGVLKEAGEVVTFAVDLASDPASDGMVDAFAASLFEGYDAEQAYRIVRSASRTGDGTYGWENTGEPCTPGGSEPTPPPPSGLNCLLDSQNCVVGLSGCQNACNDESSDKQGCICFCYDTYSQCLQNAGCWDYMCGEGGMLNGTCDGPYYCD